MSHTTRHVPGRTDVLVVGAGPTGLLLAGDLAEAGVDVTLAERRPPGLGNLSRAFGVHARTLEQLDARGLADELVTTGTRLTRLQLFGRLDLDLTVLRSRFPFLLITPQYEVEKLLERRAVAAGVRFRHDTEVTGFTQDAEGVTVRLGGERILRAAYVVGADGHRSTVRRELGLPFPGRTVLGSMVLADVRLAAEPEEVLTIRGVGDTFAGLAPFGDGWYRVMGWSRHHQVDDHAPLDLDEVRDIARRALGTDHGMYGARWLSRFHSDERQVPAYRVGRVLLAGDAAHTHSPAGGQGMNTGLQDAANLGWKLAAVVQGRAPERLLDTYHAERHPVGRMVLRSSGALVRLAMARGRATRVLRDAVSVLVSVARPLSARALGMISGIGISYARERGTHRLTGTRVPDLPLREGRLYEALRAGRFVLVLPPDATPPPSADEHDVVVVHHAAAPPGPTALLVRPDAYLTWAGPPSALTTWPIAELTRSSRPTIEPPKRR